MSEFEERAAEGRDETPYADREAYLDDGLAGVPLSVLVFVCAEHGEEAVVEYYDPDEPPRCSHGDLMTRRGESSAGGRPR